MSQNTHSPAVEGNHEESPVNASEVECGWANFGAFENNLKPNSGEGVEAVSDDWADFQTPTEPPSDHPVNGVNATANDDDDDDDDAFGDFSDVHSPTESPIPTLSVNSLRDEQIESVISTCFPLEPAPILVENDHVLSSTLPSFTTAHDAIKTIACFQPSLSLWKVLANVSNDPLGIQHQWRKSHTERYFHQALGVHERLRIKTTPATSPSETPATTVADDNENKPPLPAASPSFDWKSSGLQNPLTDDPSSVVRASVSEGENAVCDVNKALDLDYYILPAATPDRERSLTSSAVVQRNPSPVPSAQAAPIKTVDLFPGSTTVKNDDAKAISDSATNYTSINPKALLFSTQTNAESNVSN